VKLPEIYSACAHPQAVWFEEHWRPIFVKLKAENDQLKAQVDKYRNEWSELAVLNHQNYLELSQEREKATQLKIAVDKATEIIAQEMAKLKVYEEALVHCKAAMTYAYEDSGDQYYLNVLAHINLATEQAKGMK